jgi:hypothetical protein
LRVNPKPLTPEQRQQRARMGGLATASRHDPKKYTEAAHKGWHNRFLNEVDPKGVLPEPERRRRADAAQRLYMQKLAWKSAQARRRNKAAK